MELGEFYRARGIVEDLLLKDLHGPVSEDEVISDTMPTEYYVCGLLHPHDIEVPDEEREGSLLCGDSEGYEVPINLCYAKQPSAFGMSFTVRSGTTKLRGIASFARYVREEPAPGEGAGSPYGKWRRNAGSVAFEIELESGRRFRATELTAGLEVRTYVQRIYSDGARTLTVAMVNTAEKKKDRSLNCAATFFQPRIEIRGREDGEAPFINRKPRIGLNQDPELLGLEMLYRHNPTFATGHGCSAGWESDGDCATLVYSDFIPAYEVSQMEPVCHVRPEVLAFRFLGYGNVQEVCTGLEEMALSYGRWIAEKEEAAAGLPERYSGAAATNLSACRESMSRIMSGINLLAADESVRSAFQLMNIAMLRQNEQRNGGKSGNAGSGRWYPFQLAFILQEIGSVADAEDPYRETVDLLWFPTGGGKTEAYLGLAAFTIFLRRIRAGLEGRPGGGVSIIMRYTLRLLTIQQFGRAAGLICACELIRRDNTALLGNDEIAAGLWVGGAMTPNRREEARKSLEKIRATAPDWLGDEESNPCQILTCPWCGAEIRPQHYSVGPGGLKIVCPGEECPFGKGLPLYLIDEDIYLYGPALVVSTIDKFARMTWQPEVGKLFGIGTDCRPPELIIQDELHLISGPLGTVAGLYEIAVDELSTNKGIKAKIISSTATVRNAAGQIRSLYGRDCRQFPAQGIDIRDSYFAREASKTARPTRQYRGILTPGVSGTTRLVRIYSVLLMARSFLEQEGFSTEVVDSFWTLTGYFNTIKDLGGAVVNIMDDVQARIKYLYGKKFEALLSDNTSRRWVRFDELTSRKKGSEIADVLARLEAGYPAPEALDVILASSMLSVGIDIGRLGLMVMQGQPKTNAEYIQATGRVGRKTPGLVVTMYDASRSRDCSHYEQFRAYHASLHRYVEASSLTPFSERARDRALHAVLVSLCRHLVPELRDNVDAGNIRLLRSRAEAIMQTILQRTDKVDSSESDSTRKELSQFLDIWEARACGIPDLVYQKYAGQSGSALLTSRFDGDGDEFPTLNSMRDVDVECNVFLKG